MKDLIQELQTMDSDLPIKMVACDGIHVIEGYLQKGDAFEDVEWRDGQRIVEISYIS
ncbi:hypothetical protein HRD62_03410 [Lactobacillus brevis]|uniref:hypothetical protein n=1 Tax=Levilactobacillus brevis TaxID=1580 RepID=UPI00155E1985|nr:hypothetical protein [Levilactobacillus brevis]NRD28653.1 hypothetical protein [Levilactobacillus brevis]